MTTESLYNQIPTSLHPEVANDWEKLQVALASVKPILPVLMTLSADEIRAKIAEDSEFGNSVGLLADLCDKYAPNSGFIQTLTQV